MVVVVVAAENKKRWGEIKKMDLAGGEEEGGIGKLESS